MKKNTHLNKLFFFIILFIIIVQSISSISFTYPSSISLSNGNILIIHKSGISICNSFLTEIISNVTNFSEEEILTTDSLSKITSIYENDYIFNIINDKIYIFNDVGNLLYQSENTILEEENPGYYTLIPMKKDNDFYYYLIGFVNNHSFSFLYYKFNIENNNNTKIYKQKGFKHKYYTSDNNYELIDIENNGLSCQYMIDKNNIVILVCFFIIKHNEKYYITIEHFNVGENEISINRNFTCNHFIFENCIIVKSAINHQHTKSLKCFYLVNGYSKCITYDINIEYGNTYSYFDYNSSKCRDQYYGFKVDYYIEQQSSDYFLFSCINEFATILFGYFNGGLEYGCAFEESFKFIDCQNIYGYSILYLKDKNDYFVVSDVTCNEGKYPFEILEPLDEESDIKIVEEIDYKIESTQNDENNSSMIESTQNDENNSSMKSEENIKTDENTINDKKSENSEISEISQKSETITENIKNSLSIDIDKIFESSVYSEGSENSKGIEKTENSQNEIISESFLKEEIRESSEIINKELIKTDIDYEKTEDLTKCKDLEKCETYNKESLSKCLCLTCNFSKGYYLLNNKLSKIKNLEIYGDYIDCVNDLTKPSNFYFNNENNDYEECYETCNTCFYGGDKNENNCSSCENNYIKEPDILNSSNCVLKYPYLYYYNSYGKYKCTSIPNCPDVANLLTFAFFP